MAKLDRLCCFMCLDDLGTDINAAEKALKKNIVGEPRGSAAVLAGIKSNFLRTAQNVFSEKLNEKIEEFKMFKGERPDVDFEDWDAGIDEVCEEIAALYSDVLSQNWLGAETIDTHLHEDGEIERLSKSFAKEAYKQITDKATGEEIIAVTGVPVAEYVASFASPEAKKEAEASEQEAFACAVKRIADAHRAAYDLLNLYDFLDNATDSDDGLAFGGINSLIPVVVGEDVTPFVRAFQNYRKENGKDAVQKILDLIVDAMYAPVTAEAKVVEIAKPQDLGKTKPEKPAKKQEEPKAAEFEERLVVPAGVLKDWQEALGNDDTKMGAVIKTSRQSWSNYVTGKREFAPTREQLYAINGTMLHRQMVVSQALEALAKMVG